MGSRSSRSVTVVKHIQSHCNLPSAPGSSKFSVKSNTEESHVPSWTPVKAMMLPVSCDTSGPLSLCHALSLHFLVIMISCLLLKWQAPWRYSLFVWYVFVVMSLNTIAGLSVQNIVPVVTGIQMMSWWWHGKHGCLAMAQWMSLVEACKCPHGYRIASCCQLWMGSAGCHTSTHCSAVQ